MAKKVFYDEDARSRLLGGAKVLYDAVKVTYGPKGGNVVIAKSYGSPTVTHDGVTVAEAVDVLEEEETLGYKTGAELIKQAASKLNKVAGDGTTTVTVLTYQMLQKANRLIAAGHNPQELKKGMLEAGKDVVELIAKKAESIEGKIKRTAEVATISAGGNVDVGQMVADMVNAVGKDGVLTVESGQDLEVKSEVVEGYNLDKGWSSPFFVTDTSRQEAVYEKPAVVITDQKISNAQELLPLIEKLAQSGKKDIVLVADEVEGEALSVLVLNKLKGVLNTVVVKAPSYGDRRKEIMADMAVLTGAEVISEDRGMSLDSVGLEVVGSARKVIVGKDSTTVIEGAGEKSAVSTRITEINQLAENTTSEYDREQLEKRSATLGGKVAVIKVGGATETEIEEMKFRVEDAVAATKAALAEGIVSGGGVTLVNAARELIVDGTDSVSAGRQVVRDALYEPFVQITQNAGLNSQALLAQVQSAKDGMGVDVMDQDARMIDMKKSGVIDPARVTKQAVQNSVSIAATAATMGALVVEIPEPEAPAPQMGGGMPMM